MAKCKDGEKYVNVKGYETKGGTNVSQYSRSCPSTKSSCCVCGEELASEKLHEVSVKGETKYVCDECVDTIHGLI